MDRLVGIPKRRANDDRPTLRAIVARYLDDEAVERLHGDLLRNGYIQFARRLEKEWR